MPPTLQDIFAKYASTCCDTGTDKTTVHSYGDLYSSLLAPMKSDVRNVLDIGACSGASACVWAEFFEDARVDAIDIDLSRVRFHHPRVTFHRVNAASSLVAHYHQSLAPQYDLVVDDGSHEPADQLQALRNFGPRLTPGRGVFILEDIDRAHMPWLKEKLASEAVSLGLVMEWFDLQHVKGRYDDIVAVFRR